MHGDSRPTYNPGMPNIVVLASFNMDLVMRTERRPLEGETLQGTFAMHLGGKGFNQAVAARRMGADVTVVGCVGDDDFGRRFRDGLQAEGIDTAHVAARRSLATGVASVVVDARGENSIVQAPAANRSLTATDVGAVRSKLGPGAVAMLQLETSMEAQVAFASMARDAGATVILNPAPAPGPLPPHLLRACDIIVPNALEARTLSRVAVESVADALEAAGAIRRLGPHTCVITLGAAGAVIDDGSGGLHVEAPIVDVVDTVGAGDAFCAGLAVRIAEGAGIREALGFAVYAGAVACTREGAGPAMPRREAVEALLQGRCHEETGDGPTAR